ncbi:DnaJ C-terminal domain-containing protein [Actinomyces culturomici]|uniref:DnaJ C-terminal domain-containing protein n=1 Tax=Actinomyces culturomici TaxID=1926276 RepID=UPI000E1FD982|nr:DnaJ C-terminal domain-containing protein [Actinomyces culturomici]
MSEQEWFDKDFYAVLGVAKDADDAAIKKAYRKLARQWHPDQNPGDAKAEEKFKEIGEAYSVLSDKEQRARYDAIRRMAGGGARFAAGSGAGGPDLSDLFGSAFGGSNIRMNFSGSGAGGPDLSDILGGMFGGASQGFGAQGFSGGSPFGAGASRTPRARKGDDRRATARITFREALAGTEVVMTIDSKKQKVRLPKGVKDGQRIRLRGKGRPGINGGEPGDLEVTIRVDAHPVFTRDGDNLRVTVPVTFAEAVLGAKIEVPLIDGTTVTVKVPAGTQSGAVLRVRKRGVETAKTTGDLLIDVRVAVPEKLSGAQKDAVKALADALGDADPRSGLLAAAKE